MEENKQSIKQRVIHISDDEREKFLTGNPMPKNETESYIWFAFDCMNNGALYLFEDELKIAAEMASTAGLADLSERLK